MAQELSLEDRHVLEVLHHRQRGPTAGEPLHEGRTSAVDVLFGRLGAPLGPQGEEVADGGNVGLVHAELRQPGEALADDLWGVVVLDPEHRGDDVAEGSQGVLVPVGVAASDVAGDPPPSRLLAQLSYEPCLSAPSLAGDGEDATPTLCESGDGAGEHLQLSGPPDPPSTGSAADLAPTPREHEGGEVLSAPLHADARPEVEAPAVAAQGSHEIGDPDLARIRQGSEAACELDDVSARNVGHVVRRAAQGDLAPMEAYGELHGLTLLPQLSHRAQELQRASQGAVEVVLEGPWDAEEHGDRVVAGRVEPAVKAPGDPREGPVDGLLLTQDLLWLDDLAGIGETDDLCHEHGDALLLADWPPGARLRWRRRRGRGRVAPRLVHRLLEPGELVSEVLEQRSRRVRPELVLEELPQEGAQAGVVDPMPSLEEESAEVLFEQPGVGVPVARVAGERHLEDVPEPVGDGRDLLARVGDDGLANLPQLLLRIGVLEEPVVDEQLVEHDAAAEDVASLVDALTPRLLGAHVGELAAPGLTRGLPLELVQHASDAEVGQLHLTLETEQHVVGRHVPMNDGRGVSLGVDAGVGVCQAPGQARSDVDGDGQWQGEAHRPTTTDGARQVPPVDQLHGDVVILADLSQLVDRHDVRVAQERRDLRLADEHLDEVLRVRQLGEDALDDQALLEALHPEAPGQEHLRHSPRRDALEELVLAKWRGEVHAARRVHSRPECPTCPWWPCVGWSPSLAR